MSRGGKIEETVTLRCPKCGHAGSAEYEVNESPPHRGGLHGYDDRKLLGINGPFKEVGGGYDPAIFCDCGEKVR